MTGLIPNCLWTRLTRMNYFLFSLNFPNRVNGYSLSPWALWLALSLTACGGGEGGGAGGSGGSPGAAGASGAAGWNALVKVRSEPAGSNCTAAGSRIDAGLDKNKNDLLDAAEITSTQYACGGTGGGNGSNTLVSLVNEPAGSNCATGGKKVNVGTDSNGNGTLDSHEITSSSYVCNSSTGSAGATGNTGAAGSNGHNTLVKITTETAGSNCAYGGAYVQSGIDVDDNGSLSASEATSSVYVCHGAPAGLRWTTLTGSSVQAVGNMGYIANNDATPVQITLPANPNFGDVIRIHGTGSAGWRVVQNAGQSIYVKNLPGDNIGRLPRLASTRWKRFTLSSDGKYLSALPFSGQIQISSDGGQTWKATGNSNTWVDLVASGNGAQLLAASANEKLYYSNDSGETWSALPPANAAWTAVAMSENGARMAAANSSGALLTWDNYGATFNSFSVAPLQFLGLSISPNGTHLAGTVKNSNWSIKQIGVANFPYSNWTVSAAPSESWTRVACSDSCSTILAVSASIYGKVYVSRNQGSSWSTPSPGDGYWDGGLAVSPDGMTLGAAGEAGVYISRNGGLGWSLQPGGVGNWSGLAMTPNGNKWISGLKVNNVNSQPYIASDWSTPGTSGGLSGNQYDSMELQYMGNGKFNAVSGLGSFTAQ